MTSGGRRATGKSATGKSATGKSSAGNFFEDFSLGQVLPHAPSRSVGSGEQALYVALTGSRFALHCSDSFARSLGYQRAPLDDLLTFHLVFGQSVPDVSLNAVANLGYAGCRFGAPLYPGDELSAESRVIGLKQNSDGKSGVVYVETKGVNQRGALLVEFRRWAMVRKRDANAPAPKTTIPELTESVAPGDFILPEGFDLARFDPAWAGTRHVWEDYAPGERVDHLDGMTLEEAEHQSATRLYQNTARVHFDLAAAKGGRFGRRLVYGGHVISLARALSFNGLGSALRVAAINGGRHVAPVFAGDTLYAWSEVLERLEVPGRRDLAALRLRTLALKDKPAAGFPGRSAEGGYDPAVVLDLDYSVLLPRRAAGAP